MGFRAGTQRRQRGGVCGIGAMEGADGASLPWRAVMRRMEQMPPLPPLRPGMFLFFRFNHEVWFFSDY